MKHYKQFLIVSLIGIALAFMAGCATAPLVTAPASTAPTSTAIANSTSSLFSKIAAFNAGIAAITPAQIQADAANLQAQIVAFNAAAAPVVNTMAGVASIAAAAIVPGSPEVVTAIGLANSAIQAANAITKASTPPVIPMTSTATATAPAIAN